MRKSGVVTFIVLSLVVAAIVYVAIVRDGSRGSSEVKVATTDEEARALFATNCGACHTLARAGTDGVVGPDLDELLGMGTPEGNRKRVLSAIENGVGGRMPAGILAGAQAEEVADFVARTAGN